MNCLQKLLGTVLVAFSGLSAYALHQHGACGFLHQAVANSAAVTLSTDLVIALSLVSVWLFRDARARGKSPWPYLILTALLGSVGPLAYLVCKEGCSTSKGCGERLVS